MRQGLSSTSSIAVAFCVAILSTVQAYPAHAQITNLVYAPGSASSGEIQHRPQLDTEHTVEIGQSLIYSNHYVSRRSFSSIKLQTTVEDKPNPPGTTRVNAGTLRLLKISDEGKFYLDRTAKYLMVGAEVPTDDSGIFVPKDKAKPAVIYHYLSGGMFGLGKGYTFGTIPVATSDETIETIETVTQNSLRRELVYAGVMQKVLTLLYREFKGDFARPAFSQEIKYDLSQGTTIGYKGARFEVIKATNIDLDYKVLRHLE